jgi:hypothetical protein
MKTHRDVITEIGEGTQDDSELLFEMANLVQRDTGLPFVIWVSPKGNVRRHVRVKVSAARRPFHPKWFQSPSVPTKDAINLIRPIT